MTMTAHPALVLNADFRPMSYFPLSLLSWQDAISAVFSQRVSVVAEYDACAQPVHADSAALGGGAAQVSAAAAARRVHALQRVPARSLCLSVLRRSIRGVGADVRACRSALARRTDDLVKHRHRMRPVQHGQGQLAAH
jgi:5-methylcytosine-specific restriction endonuclease McrA